MSPVQLDEHLKALDAQIEAYNKEKVAKRPSFLQLVMQGKLPGTPKKLDNSPMLSNTSKKLDQAPLSAFSNILFYHFI